MPEETYLFSVSMSKNLKPIALKRSATIITSSLRSSLGIFFILPSSPTMSASPSLTARGTLALPSVIATTQTWPTSELAMALLPMLMACVSACASGVPPPQGSTCMLPLARATEDVGETRTSARVPRQGISATWSRLWYADSSNRNTAPLAFCMRFSAMEPLASTTKMTKAPAFRAIFLTQMSLLSTYTFLRCSGGSLRSASSRRIFWKTTAFRNVASNAILPLLLSPPLGSIAFTYLPRSIE
mmetsp:Transcript_80300/g.245444  ORF Transcript_80300/g.245444 Transcript_80300/m.245444 type:complete len:243 (-) Transcript_80300:1325-2053(-)